MLAWIAGSVLAPGRVVRTSHARHNESMLDTASLACQDPLLMIIGLLLAKCRGGLPRWRIHSVGRQSLIRPAPPPSIPRRCKQFMALISRRFLCASLFPESILNICLREPIQGIWSSCTPAPNHCDHLERVSHSYTPSPSTL